MAQVPLGLQGLCILGWTLQGVLDHSAAAGTRSLHVGELWAGVGAVAGAGAVAGFSSQAFDKNRVPGVTDVDGPSSEDVLVPSGFWNALTCVLSIVEGGLLMMAPCCKSMGFMNRKNTCRTSENPEGNLMCAAVQDGNAQAKVAAFLFALACLRGIKCVVENPVGSVLFSLPVWELIAAHFDLRSSLVARCRFDRKPMGKRYLKLYRMVGLQWSCHLSAACQCRGRGHRRTTQEKWVNGKKHVTGLKKQLKESGAYTPALGKWIVNKWLEASPTMQQLPAARHALAARALSQRHRQQTRRQVVAAKTCSGQPGPPRHGCTWMRPSPMPNPHVGPSWKRPCP